MKVTMVCDVLGEENNGTTIAAMNLYRSLIAKGHEVKILCPDQNKKNTENYYIVPVLNLGILNGYVKKNGVTIAKADNKVINEALSDTDIVHIMVPFTLGRHALKLAKEKNLPVTAGFHAMAENLSVHIFMKNSHLVNRITYSSFHKFYKYIDAIHYPTQYLRDLYEGMYGITNGYVISNGVNKRFKPVPTKKPDNFKDKYVILFTGRYSGEKSHPLLIDGVNKSKYRDKIQLIFAGDGPKKKALIKYAEKLPIMPMFSFFSREEMLNILNYSDLYVHPAEIEAEGIACLEAIACGLVPIISDSPRSATKYYAIDDKNLFHYNSPESLAEKIDYWLEHPEEKKKRSQEYLNYAKDRFDQDECMNKMEQMLIETIKNHKNCQKK